MREQIRVDIPRRLGHLIKEGLVESILIKVKHKDIILTIKEDEEFIEDFNAEIDPTIQVEINQIIRP